MKRILSPISALILCAALLAAALVPASAAGGARTTPVVPRLTPAASSEAPSPQGRFAVDETGETYETLNAALEAATAGQTVSLLANAVLPENAALPAGVTLALGTRKLTVPAGVTLDASSGSMTAASAGKLVVSGTVICSGNAANRIPDSQVELRPNGVYDGFTAPAVGEAYVPDRSQEKAMSLYLKDAVGINYYLTDSGLASAYALTDGAQTPMVREGVNWYLSVRASAAKELCAESTVQPVGVDAAGAHHLGKPNTISIRGYAEDQIRATNWRTEDGVRGAKLGRTMIALLNYGAAAQSCFGYQTDDLANRNVDSYQSRMTVYTSENLGTYRTDHLTKDDPRNLYYASSCVLGSSQALRFYLNLPESVTDRESLTFRASFRNYNGVQRSVEKTFAQLSGTDAVGVYFLEIPGMAAADVETPVTLTVKKNSAAVATVTDSIAGYCARAYELEAETHGLVDALLIYGLSARDYFYKPAAMELEAYELPVIRVSW